MRRSLAAVGIVTALAAAAACGGGSSGGGSGGGTNGSSGAGTSGENPNANGCTAAAAPVASPQQFTSEPPVTIARTTYTATLVTNCGTITLALDGAKAPHTVNSFAFLAGKHFFDNSPCHRLTTAEAGISVLQCGDPTGSGRGGPGYTIPDENLKGATYPTGTVAMANTGAPHSGGSQFFLVYADTPLPPQYTPFGTVTGGLDVIKRIAAAGPTSPGDGAPKQPVTIKTFTVTKAS